MLTYPWHRAEIMRNTPDFTPKSAQNAYKQKITVADIVSTTVTDLVAGAGFEPTVSAAASVGPGRGPPGRRPLQAMGHGLRSEEAAGPSLPRNEKSQALRKGVPEILWLRGQDLNLRPSGYEGRLAVTCSPAGPFPGVFAGGFRKTYPT